MGSPNCNFFSTEVMFGYTVFGDEACCTGLYFKQLIVYIGKNLSCQVLMILKPGLLI